MFLSFIGCLEPWFDIGCGKNLRKESIEVHLLAMNSNRQLINFSDCSAAFYVLPLFSYFCFTTSLENVSQSLLCLSRLFVETVMNNLGDKMRWRLSMFFTAST